jgi:hypothetical protein|tara:strand:- start:773 stop:982 length:210 start_codon:yes stop_codon:yes gene_type:complete
MSGKTAKFLRKHFKEAQGFDTLPDVLKKSFKNDFRQIKRGYRATPSNLKPAIKLMIAQSEDFDFAGDGE